MSKKVNKNFRYSPGKGELNAMSKCNGNRITIYPVLIGSEYTLTVMKANGFKQVGKQSFNTRKDDWIKKIFELYLILEKQL